MSGIEGRRLAAHAIEELTEWAERKNAGDESLHREEFYRVTEYAQTIAAEARRALAATAEKDD